MRFEYFKQLVVGDQLEIDDIGNVCIIANDDVGHTYTLIVRTVLGQVQVWEFGPIIPEINELPPSVVSSYSRFEYSDNKVTKVIDKFLNNSYRSITQARVVDISEARKNMRNILEYIER